MGWMWGSGMCGGWWFFPIMGLLFMAVMFFICSRIFSGRRGFCGSRGRDEGEVEALRKEIRDLRDEVEKLRRRE